MKITYKNHSFKILKFYYKPYGSDLHKAIKKNLAEKEGDVKVINILDIKITPALDNEDYEKITAGNDGDYHIMEYMIVVFYKIMEY